MDNVKAHDKDSADASSDGEEDFESADEGEGKEVSTTYKAGAVLSNDTGGVRNQTIYEASDANTCDKKENVGNRKSSLSGGMTSSVTNETELPKSTGETNNVESSRNILEPPTGSPRDTNTGTSSIKDKEDIVNVSATEEQTDISAASSRDVRDLGNMENEE